MLLSIEGGSKGEGRVRDPYQYAKIQNKQYYRQCFIQEMRSMMLFIYQRQGKTEVHIKDYELKSCVRLQSAFHYIDGVFLF